VQALKAGLLEIADVHVVNKADRDGADRTVAELRDMLRLVKREHGQWRIPIQKTVASNGEGVAGLIGLFDEHLGWMDANGERERRARRNAATRIRWLAEELVLDHLRPGVPDFDRAVDEVSTRRCDPVTAARTLIERL
jgi:LAO/AO transport system kinase